MTLAGSLAASVCPTGRAGKIQAPSKGQWLQRRRRPRLGKGGWWRGEWFGPKCGGAFFELDAVIHRQIGKLLEQSIRPADGGPDLSFRVPEAKEQFLGVLGQKAGSSLKVPGLAKGSNIHGDCRSDRVTVALPTTQPEGDGVPDGIHRVVQDAQRCRRRRKQFRPGPRGWRRLP